jgi:flotillin
MSGATWLPSVGRRPRKPSGTQRSQRRDLRVRQAQLDQEGETTELTAKVRAKEAEVEALRELEVKRVQREQERLRADVIVPANAQREAAKALAEGEAAPILEQGKAQVQVLRMLYDEIKAGGEEAYSVFIAEKLPNLLGIAVDAVKGVDIDRVVVMDGGSGQGVSSAVNQRVQGAFGTLEALGSALGIDIQEVVQGASKRVAPQASPPSQAEAY